MTMTASQVIVAMRELLSSPENWSKRAYARDHRGEECDSLDPNAKSYCLAGARSAVLQHVPIGAGVRREVHKAIQDALAIVDDKRRFSAQYNDADETTHDDILTLLNVAEVCSLQIEQAP